MANDGQSQAGLFSLLTPVVGAHEARPWLGWGGARGTFPKGPLGTRYSVCIFSLNQQISMGYYGLGAGYYGLHFTDIKIEALGT